MYVYICIWGRVAKVNNNEILDYKNQDTGLIKEPVSQNEPSSTIATKVDFYGLTPAHFAWTYLWYLIHWIILSFFVWWSIVQNNDV